jgi:hypothetical protein
VQVFDRENPTLFKVAKQNPASGVGERLLGGAGIQEIPEFWICLGSYQESLGFDSGRFS